MWWQGDFTGTKTSQLMFFQPNPGYRPWTLFSFPALPSSALATSTNDGQPGPAPWYQLNGTASSAAPAPDPTGCRSWTGEFTGTSQT
jgi:hypothetical protein